MAKRFVESCDLCKQEAELDNTLTLKLSKSKKSGRSYDLCDKCKESLEKALVSRERIYGFSDRVPVEKSGTPENSKSSEPDSNTLELPDGTTREIPNREQLKRGNQDDPGAFSEEIPVGRTEEGEDCIHMNRTPPRITDGSKGKIFVQCRDCGADIPYKSARAKEMELNVSIPAGVKVSTHPTEDRKNR